MNANTDFAVLHLTKYKSLPAIGRHIDRKHLASNVDAERTHFNEELRAILGAKIDPAKTELREEWVAQGRPLEEDVAARIEQGYTQAKAIRKDAVKAVGVIMTGSHERIKEIESDPALFDRWKKANYDFACQEFGQENIVRFTLHRDEKTPHFHCVFVPITPQGGLSAKQFMERNTGVLRGYQDRYAQAMQPFGLQRGTPVELTQRAHIPTKQYYRTVNTLGREAEKMTEGVQLKNAFRLQEVRGKLTHELVQLQTKLLEKDIQYKYATRSNRRLIQADQRAAFQQRLQQEAGQAYKSIKTAIPLIEFASNTLAWKRDKHKSSQKDIVLSHPQHGKIIVPNKPKEGTGHWVFSWVDKQGGGTLIDLLLLEGWSWKAIKELAHDHLATTPVASLAIEKTGPQRIVAQDSQQQLVQAQFEATRPSEGKSYLARRGIDKQVYADLPQVRVNATQATFRLYQGFQRVEHVCSTINYYLDRDGSSRKYFQKGLPRGIAVLKQAGSVARLVVTESPIDALSLKQLEEARAHEQQVSMPNTMYVSTCGSLSAGIQQDLQHLFARAKDQKQEVVLALDNDLAGRKMTNTLAELLAQQGLAYQVSLPPQGKDWNAYLTLQQEQTGLSRQDQAGKEQATLKAWQEAPQLQHSATLLKQLGIREAACEGLAGYRAGAKEIVFPLYQSVQAVAAQKPCGTYRVGVDEQGLSYRYGAEGMHEGLVVLPPKRAAQQVVVTTHSLDIFLHRQQQLEALSQAQLLVQVCEQQEHVAQAACKAAYSPERKAAWQEAEQATERARKALAGQQERRMHTQYVCTCGHSSVRTRQALAALLGKHEKVVLYMEPEAAAALKTQLQEQGKAYTVQKPQQAAWQQGFQEAARAITTAMQDDEQEALAQQHRRRRRRGRGMRYSMAMRMTPEDE